jgi:hypothetical protein
MKKRKMFLKQNPRTQAHHQVLHQVLHRVLTLISNSKDIPEEDKVLLNKLGLSIASDHIVAGKIFRENFNDKISDKKLIGKNCDQSFDQRGEKSGRLS